MFTLSNETIKALIKYSFEQATSHGAHITRYKMYKDLTGALSEYDGADKTLLSISHSSKFARDILGLKETVGKEVNFPDMDMNDLKFDDESFDFCVSDQVLEHVDGDPFKAIAESARILKKGGIMCHTTCFINEVHDAPSDFWRFTPKALMLLAKAAGCEVIVADGWGNKEAWGLIDAGFRFQPIPNDSTNPLNKIATRSDPAWPIVVWLIAKKG